MITITMHNIIAKPDVRPSLVQLCIGMPSARCGTSRQRRHAMPTCYAAAEQCILAPLEASRQLAAMRAAEVHRAEPRFLDPLAEALMVCFAIERCLSICAGIAFEGNMSRMCDLCTCAVQADVGTSCSAADCDADAAAIAFLDEQLLRGVDIVNMDVRQEYRQVSSDTSMPSVLLRMMSMPFASV
jgi:hypothetical protein